jgi:hypothetical protein
MNVLASGMVLTREPSPLAILEVAQKRWSCNPVVLSQGWYSAAGEGCLRWNIAIDTREVGGFERLTTFRVESAKKFREEGGGRRPK